MSTLRPTLWIYNLNVSQPLSFSGALALSAQEQLNFGQKATESPVISAKQSFPPGQGWDGASGTRVVHFCAHQYSTLALIGCSKNIYIFITGTAKN